MPFDWRRLFGGGRGNPDDDSGMNPYQQQLQNTLYPQPSQGNRLSRAALAGLGGDNQQPQAPPNPGFVPYQGLAGLGAPVQFGNRPPTAPPPVAPPASPNLSQNMTGSPLAMNMGMSGTPRSTRPVDPNDPYNMNARNRMLGLA